MSLLNCQYAKICSGCPLIGKNSNEQTDFKRQTLLQELGQEVQSELLIQRPAEKSFRDKVDLTIEDNKIGFYSQEKSIFDMEECPLMSPALQELYTNFRKNILPTKKGSIRLRVSPRGLRGLWIDFSNADIKFLLDEKDSLLKLLPFFDVIEIGQKSKVLAVFEGTKKIPYKEVTNKDQIVFKLGEAELHPWFETYVFQSNKIESAPLNMHINSFSQTGFQTNQALIKTFWKFLSASKAQTALELCSGSGNFTFPLLSSMKTVTAAEMNSAALNGLQKTHKEINLPGSLKIKVCNIHKPSEDLKNLLESHQLLVVDPPRSGLGGFLEVMESTKKLPQEVIYVSCHTQSFSQDLKKIFNLGYKIKGIEGIDQFPHSNHCEWIALLQKN